MGRQAVTWGALGLLQLVVVVTLALAGPDDTTHAAPIRIVAPTVVAQALVDQSNGLDGTPFRATPLRTAAEARASVTSGRSVAAVVVDLRDETDVLYVASANGRELNRAITRQVTVVEGTYGRRAVVKDLVPIGAGDLGRRQVYAVVGLAVVAGLGVAIAITWRRGARHDTLRDGVRRQAVAAVCATVLGGVLAAYAVHAGSGDLVVWWLIAALTVLATSTVTLALEGLFGVLGIGVATTVVVLTAGPMTTLVHPLLLPEPWAAITPWLPHGAALAAGTSEAYFGADQVVRPLGVLAGWCAVSILVGAVARRERMRDA